MLTTDKKPFVNEESLAELEVQPSVSDAIFPGLDKYELRNYQAKLIRQIEESWDRGNRRVMLQLATGGGKTIIFSYLVKKFLEQNIRTLVVAHKKELITQAYEKLTSISGLEAGYIKSGFKENRECLIQVASIQTLVRRKKPAAGFLVIDEAHHSASKSYLDLFSEYSEAKILGVTATPMRNDGQGFQNLYDDLIVGPDIDWLIDEGYLSKFKLFGTPTKIDPKSRGDRASDYSGRELSRAFEKSDYVNSNALDEWYDKALGLQTVVFCVSVKHSREVCQLFQERGINAAHLDGETSDRDRDEILSKFKNKEITVLTNCGIVSEGFDVPGLECVQCIRPTTSETLWLQMLGRALRPTADKKFAVIIDHTANFLNLGLPDVHREWSLKPRSLDPDALFTRECSQCHHVFRPLPHELKQPFAILEDNFKTYERMAITCPNCGMRVLFTKEDPVTREHTFNDRNYLKVLEEVHLVEIPNGVSLSFVEIIDNLYRWYVACQRSKECVVRYLVRFQENIDIQALRLREWEFLAYVLEYDIEWAWRKYTYYKEAETKNLLQFLVSDTILAILKYNAAQFHKKDRYFINFHTLQILSNCQRSDIEPVMLMYAEAIEYHNQNKVGCNLNWIASLSTIRNALDF
ncbi:MAG: DEAD/DEAH box helicase [Prochloraceae cyanobacterium]